MKNIILICLFIPLQIFSQINEKRIALVIGNANYSTMGSLPNPENDAIDMSNALKQLGFDVITGINQSKKGMINKINQFSAKLRLNNDQSTTGLFFYAGHGMEINGENYMIPSNANMTYEEDAQFEGIDVKRVMGNMKSSKNQMNIVILDACRDNPLLKRSRSSKKSSGWGRFDETAEGMFIAYGTSKGRKAQDGTGRNGLFTKHLLRHIKTKDLEINNVFNAVRKGVLEESNKQQMTVQTSSLVGSFYFSHKNKKQSGQDFYNEMMHKISTNKSKPLFNHDGVLNDVYLDGSDSIRTENDNNNKD